MGDTEQEGIFIPFSCSFYKLSLGEGLTVLHIYFVLK